MILQKKYISLNDCLKHIRLQIEDSIDFQKTFVPQTNDPATLFNWVKPFLKYRRDPKDRELLQSAETLIYNNYYGISGTGDCDCFVIFFVSACMVQKWKNKKIWIKLAGRDRQAPVHIWSGIDINGKEYPMDLTNPLPMQERDYQYIQKIYLK
jgi:hypothetical protein